MRSLESSKSDKPASVGMASQSSGMDGLCVMMSMTVLECTVSSAAIASPVVGGSKLDSRLWLVGEGTAGVWMCKTVLTSEYPFDWT